jgi:hypothetical protein
VCAKHTANASLRPCRFVGSALPTKLSSKLAPLLRRADAIFRGLVREISSGAGGPAADTSSSLAFQRTAFESISAGPGGGAITLRGADASLLLEKTTFTNVTDFPVALLAGASGSGAGGGVPVYSDDLALEILGPDGRVTGPQALDAAAAADAVGGGGGGASGGAFLSLEDSWLTDKQQVRAAPPCAACCAACPASRRPVEGRWLRALGRSVPCWVLRAGVVVRTACVTGVMPL